MSQGRYRAYPQYKDSGIEWVGLIPHSWSVKPLFSAAENICEKNDDGAESNVLSLSYGSIIRRDVEDNSGLLPESFDTYQLVSAEDIILRLTDLQNDKRSLRVGMAKEKGIITSAYLKLTAKPPQLDSSYLYRLLHSYDTTKVFYGMGGGLRQSMKFDDMRRLDLLLPPKEEQTQIAKFLDHETAKIDRLIENQEALIRLLKEKRQAVISHAVTKGLDPHAPLKDSGIPWLGQVPAHWVVTRVKYNASLAGRIGFRGYTTDDLVDEGEGAITLSPSNFAGGNLTFEKKTYISWRKYHESPEIKLAIDDIVMVKTGSTLGKIGFVDRVDEPMTINPQIVIFKEVRLRSRFLFHYLGSPLIQSLVKVSNTGGTMPTMTQECIGNYPLLFPPLDEQDEIVAVLSEHCRKFDGLIEHTERALTLLQERRTALISAAVTGKIDVRHWQPPPSTER